MKKIERIDKRADRPIVVLDLEKSTYKAKNKVYGVEGVCPTLLARDYKDPYRICWEE